jgi:hypothetical protein
MIFSNKAFDDLMYVLGKYLFIHLAQQGSHVRAQETLFGDLKSHVERELGRGGGRAQWFSEDFRMLQELLVPMNHYHSLSSAAKNPYLTWDWDREISTFWKSASGTHIAGKTPLYAFALSAGLPEEDDIDNSILAGLGKSARESEGGGILGVGTEVVKLEDALEAYGYRKQCKRIMASNGPSSPEPASSKSKVFAAVKDGTRPKIKTEARIESGGNTTKLRQQPQLQKPLDCEEQNEIPQISGVRDHTSKPKHRKTSSLDNATATSTLASSSFQPKPPPTPPPPSSNRSSPTQISYPHSGQASSAIRESTRTPDPANRSRPSSRAGTMSLSKATGASFNRPKSSAIGSSGANGSRKDSAGGSDEFRKSTTRRDTASAKCTFCASTLVYFRFYHRAHLLNLQFGFSCSKKRS